jgi:flagellar biosynthesis protein FlhF
MPVPHSSISHQLSSIQQMVSQLTRESMSRGDDVPAELFQLYTELIDAEVDEELARDLVGQLKRECTSDELTNAAAVKTRLRNTVDAEIRCAAPIAATPGRRRVVALVGPTGVGKTTTIAKLAANFRLRDGIRMGLVTVDTYRIAAVEQLRTYAEIIDLPMKVVTSPREMRRALDELNGLDLVLIDTAGRSPRDELKIQELKSLLAEARVDEVHLVLSLVASARSLEATAEKFAPAGTTALILTKLDEAVGMGSLLSVSRRVPLPISYLTTGQDVPDDIEHAEARRISRLVLGEETLFTRRREAA